MPTLDNAHAVVVGIACYRHLTPLPEVKDAPDIAALLRDPDRGGYPKDNVQLLQEEQATQANLRAALAKLAGDCDADSTAFLYFSGHGGRIESGPCMGEYLLPVDTLYPGEAELARTAVSGEEFTAALYAIAVRKVLVVLDCCHAGGIGQPRELRPAPAIKPGLSEGYYEGLKAGRGRVIVASSRATESSWVLPGQEYGLFTRHFLGGLSGGVRSGDGYVRVFDLFEYLQPRVTKEQPNQHPLFKAELEENFPVALYQGGRAGNDPRDEQGFRYDAYVSYVDREPDATWVWDTLVPTLKQAGLRVAVAGDSDDPGVPRLVNRQRGVEQAKRTVVVLGPAYLGDALAEFEELAAQMTGIEEKTYRLLPVKLGGVNEGRLPMRLRMLSMLDFSQPRQREREVERLLRALRGPLPRR
jgi:hypothetical protein